MSLNIRWVWKEVECLKIKRAIKSYRLQDTVWTRGSWKEQNNLRDGEHMTVSSEISNQMCLLFYTTSRRICFLKQRCEALKTQRWGNTKENRDFLQNKEQWPHERPTSNCTVILYRALVGPFIPRHVQLHRVFTARLWPCIRGRGFKESGQKKEGGGNNPAHKKPNVALVICISLHGL